MLLSRVLLSLLAVGVLAAPVPAQSPALKITTHAGRRPDTRASHLRLAPDGNFYGIQNDTVVRRDKDGFMVVVAGGPISGVADGPAADARFNVPLCPRMDSKGNIFVLDAYNHAVRKIAPDGMVSTFAGRRMFAGYADGPGHRARFWHPTWMTIDKDDNLYVTELSNLAVRKISPDGMVTTVVKARNISGHTDFTPFAAEWGPDGRLYMVCYMEIRRLEPDGTTVRIAGGNGYVREDNLINGTGDQAWFGIMQGLIIDKQGNLYTRDASYNAIRKITPDGVVTCATSPFGRWMDGPWGVCDVTPAGELWVADRYQAFSRVMPDGSLERHSGPEEGFKDGDLMHAEFRNPSYITSDRSLNLYVADSGNNAIRRISTSGQVTTIAGGEAGYVDGPVGSARFNYPRGLAVAADGTVFVCDVQNNAIRVISPQGVVSTLAGGRSGWINGPGATAAFDGPSGITLLPNGDLLVADGGNDAIRRVKPDGTVSTYAATKAYILGGEIGGRFDSVSDVEAAPDGRAFCAVFLPDIIGCIYPRDQWMANYGGMLFPNNYGPMVDGFDTKATFYGPTSVSYAPDGSVYVTDTNYYAIRRITPDKYVHTVAGEVRYFPGFRDGTGFGAGIHSAWGLHVDDAGTVWIADSLNHSIRKGVLVGNATPPRPPNDDTTGRLANLSTRGPTIQEGSPHPDRVLIGGFTVATKGSFLVRMMGPSLRVFGVDDAADDTALTVFNSRGEIIAANDQWMEQDQTSLIAERAGTCVYEAGRVMGAFSYTNTFTGTKDAAVFLDLEPGTYTVHGRATGDSPSGGVVLFEVYRFDDGLPNEGRLGNVSTRGYVGTGGSVMIPGFIFECFAPQTRKFLIRAVGPELDRFGVTEVLANPKLSVVDANRQVIAANDDWSTAPANALQCREAFALCGAFGLTEGSKDAALVIEASPGAFTVVCEGSDGGIGNALVEVYILPE